jgi:hypothetical protein
MRSSGRNLGDRNGCDHSSVAPNWAEVAAMSGPFIIRTGWLEGPTCFASRGSAVRARLAPPRSGIFSDLMVDLFS